MKRQQRSFEDLTCPKRMNNGYLLLFTFIVILLSGCTLTPGSHISLPSNQSQYMSGDVLVNIRPLTARLVTDLNKENSVSTLSKSIELSELLPSYKIGVGDVITIVVWEHPELTSPLGQFRASDEQGNVVYEDGTIFYPYAGSIHVVGKTVSEIRTIITERLKQYIEEPQVDVRVAGYNSQKFVVSGEVKQPGVFPITNVPVRVLDALTASGGLDISANLFAATLTRDNEHMVLPLYDMLYKGDMQHNLFLQHGDVLNIQENTPRKVFVMGEVPKPQSIVIENHMLSLTDALSTVGGINEIRANGNGIYVVRQTDSAFELDVFHVSIAQAYYLALADQFSLQERDVVYVSAAPINRWNRFISNILPSITSLRTIDDIGQ